jgi:hypothetical protein
MRNQHTKDPFRLDPACFPKRLDLDLSDEAIARIEHRAAQTGRSFSEVVTDLISRSMNDWEKGRHTSR